MFDVKNLFCSTAITGKKLTINGTCSKLPELRAMDISELKWFWRITEFPKEKEYTRELTDSNGMHMNFEKCMYLA